MCLPSKKKWGRNGGEGSFFKMGKNCLGAVNEIEAIDLMADSVARTAVVTAHLREMAIILYCTVVSAATVKSSFVQRERPILVKAPFRGKKCETQTILSAREGISVVCKDMEHWQLTNN